ncbi:MAG: hypothetical protein HN742_42615 [Lentisphaerae bacterium]|jgi:NAD+ kinase|nr:hypothetical protein [Lentisphaerota bacterium]MBT4821781.1 hypothetical protein [Lentisphaerota bacterium]MBT5607892.1 hypothetical protein [Lentisphaerota bacterium]MBT7062063.1 hypothetical protein [Lentisphaerota bacterium]MBT7848632.1 hypothetical protein [Lentisphaerota bacterium]
MRVALCGRNLGDLRELLAPLPVTCVDVDPELVISYGGDGALLGAERDYPGVPKCPLRDSRANPKCAAHSEESVLRQLVDGGLSEERIARLVGETQDGKSIVGINDVLINKHTISSAVRYRLWLDGELYMNQIVGDGLVIATPFGSTGYYRSITHSLFRVGIGLAFNNSTEPLDHLVIDRGSVVTVEIIRGPAVMLADNDPVRIPLVEGDHVTVRKSEQSTRVLGLDVFRCPDCLRLRQESS